MTPFDPAAFVAALEATGFTVAPSHPAGSLAFDCLDVDARHDRKAMERLRKPALANAEHRQALIAYLATKEATP